MLPYLPLSLYTIPTGLCVYCQYFIKYAFFSPRDTDSMIYFSLQVGKLHFKKNKLKYLTGVNVISTGRSLKQNDSSHLLNGRRPERQ